MGGESRPGETSREEGGGNDDDDGVCVGCGGGGLICNGLWRRMHG